MGALVNSQQAAQSSRFQSIQILLAIFSIIFVVVIAYGYYHLLSSFGWFVGFLGGTVFVAFSWFLAKVAGTGPGGMRANLILIVPLFVISAAGVYNSMMVYLEGGAVLSDATSQSQKSFALLETAANTQLQEAGIGKKVNEASALRDALISEIRNPANCGQGPEARRLIGELHRELPGFKPLSTGGGACNKSDEIAADYNSRIGDLIARASWNDPELNAVRVGSAAARKELGDLRSEISRSYSPTRIHQIASILEGHQTNYQELLLRLGQNANTADLSQNLPIVAAQSLGNIYKLPALFLSRLGEASTWAYLIVALGFDLFLVFLFQLASRNQVRRLSMAPAIAGAW